MGWARSPLQARDSAAPWKPPPETSPMSRSPHHVIAAIAVALALAFAPVAAQTPPSAADTLQGLAAPQATSPEAGVAPRSAAQLRPVPLVFQGVTITTRSEEHTSELQSPTNLVCSL